MPIHSVVDPSTEEVLVTLDLAPADEVDRVVARAGQAFPGWAAVSTQDRSRLLRRFADTVAAHTDELAELEASNVGKPIGGAQWEAGAVADVLHYYAGASTSTPAPRSRGATGWR